MKKADGGSGASVDLPDEIFGIEPNVAVMHQVVTAQLAAKRAGTHSTKTAPRFAAAAPSRGARRAPAAPARARSARRSGAAVASRTALTRATTRSAHPRR